MTVRYSSPLRIVVCSRCGAKVVVHEVDTNNSEVLPELFSIFENSFVCFNCLNKEDKRR